MILGVFDQEAMKQSVAEDFPDFQLLTIYSRYLSWGKKFFLYMLAITIVIFSLNQKEDIRKR